MRTTRRFPYPGNPPADTTARSAPAAASPARRSTPGPSNPIGARPGQKVVVESSTKNMLRIVVLVYLIPVVLFLAGYVIMSLLTDSVAAQYAVAAAGFAAGHRLCHLL